jgi:hypothetical protein
MAAHLDQHTGALVQVLDGFLSPQETQAAYCRLSEFELPSSYLYLDLDALQAPQDLACYLPVPLAAFILVYLRRLLDSAPDQVRRHTHGFELWTTRVGRSKASEVYLHADCDEKLRIASGQVRTPLLGSVLYLGPPAGLIGGETLFVTNASMAETIPLYRFHDWAGLTAQADAVRRTEPRPGRLVLFAGHLPHGQGPVFACREDRPRLALLVNLWDARIGDVPDGICRVSPETFQAKARITAP